jgi:hypothetical protein
MAPLLFSRLLYLAWTALVVAGGCILMSFHQPFRPPTDHILALAGPPDPGHWRAIHILSPGCACSQRVLAHLAARGPLRNVAEQVLVVTGPETELPEAAANLQRVAARGFPVRWIDASAIPPGVGLLGVPLLVAVSPEGQIVYRGGYGEHSDQDTVVLQEVRARLLPTPLPLLGCAIGQHLRDRLDPLHLKYTAPPHPSAALLSTLPHPRTTP